jgi:hypothetical protein
MIKDHNDTGLAEFSVTIMLGLSLFFLGPLLVVLSRTAPSTAPICLAYFSSMASLLAIWMALGNSPFAARLLLAMLPGAALGLLTLREELSNLLLALVVPLASLPSFGFRSLGYALVRFQAKSAAREAPKDARRLQFTLRHLFGLTAVAAIYAFVARILGGEREVYGAAVVVLVVVLSLSAGAAAWAVLGPGKPGVRLVSVVAMTGVIASGLAAAFGFGPPDPEWIQPFGIWGALHALIVGMELLLFREIGYRLVRRPLAENVRAQAPLE